MDFFFIQVIKVLAMGIGLHLLLACHRPLFAKVGLLMLGLLGIENSLII